MRLSRLHSISTMIRGGALTLGVSVLLSATSAWSHQCRFFKPDKRNLCLAQKEDSRFYCQYIKDPDQQRYCLAYVDRTPQQCQSISDETLKAQCSAEAQARFDEAEAKRKAEEERRKAEEAAEAARQAPAKGSGAQPASKSN